MRKCCWKNGVCTFALHRVATNPQSVKSQYLARTIKQRAIKWDMSLCTFMFPTLILKFLEGRGSPLFPMVYLVLSEILKTWQCLMQVHPLKKGLWRSCKHFSSSEGYWVCNIYGVGIYKVISFPKLTILGNSWHLINSSALPLHWKLFWGLFSPYGIQKDLDSCYNCHLLAKLTLAIWVTYRLHVFY